MKKKLMALFLCALMIASLLPGSVIADTAASVKFGDHVTAKDNYPDETKTEITKWVSRHEDASGNFDGTYDITIESYAHAYYKPVDVVLVVDQSGSMTENYDKEHRKTNLAHLIDGLKELGDDLKDVDMANRVAVIGFASNGSDYENTELFIEKALGGVQTIGYKSSNVYEPVFDIKTSGSSYYVDADGDYQKVSYNSGKWTYSSGTGCNRKTVTVSPKTAPGDGEEYIQFYTREDVPAGKTIPTDEQYSRAFVNVGVLDGHDGVKTNPVLNTIIGKLDGSGATYPEFGLEMAYNVLKNRAEADQKRDSIVVFFTDGAPGNDDSSSTADMKYTRVSNAVKYADDIKKDFGSVIHVVGLKGGDVSTMQDFIRLIQTEGDDYYHYADDSAKLPSIFGMIYSDVIGVNELMNAETVLTEDLSDKFELNYDRTSGKAKDAVTLNTVPVLPEKDADGKLTWGEPVSAGDSFKLDVSNDESTVKVTGFNYALYTPIKATDEAGKDYMTFKRDATNAVFYDSKGECFGNKLQVIINVRPKDGNDDCWASVAPEKHVQITPTDMTTLSKDETDVCHIDSTYNDLALAFQVPLNFIKLSVPNDTNSADGGLKVSKYGQNAVVVEPAKTFTFTAKVGDTYYTPAQGTEANLSGYVGKFHTDNILVDSSEEETLISVFRTTPGKLFLAAEGNIIVEVTGDSETLMYDGKDHQGAISGVTYNIIGTGFSEANIVFDADNNAKLTGSCIDAGTYIMGLEDDMFTKKDYPGDVTFKVVKDGELNITKRRVTLLSGSDTKLLNGGQDAESHDVTVQGDGFVKADGETILHDEGLTYSEWSKLSCTKVASIDNNFKYAANAYTNLNNYVITVGTPGKLTITDKPCGLKFYDSLTEDGYHTDDAKTIEVNKNLTLKLEGGSFAAAPEGFTLSGADYVKKITADTEINTAAYVPTKTGFVFTGWTFDRDGSGNVTLTATWAADTVGPNGPDKVPDKYQITVTFAVVNGTFGGTLTERTVVLTRLDGDNKWSESAKVKLSGTDIPDDMTADTGYTSEKEGAGWGTTPNTSTELDKDTDYTYTFVASNNAVSYSGKRLTEVPTYDPQSANVVTGNKVTLVLNGGSYDDTPSGWTKSGDDYTKTIDAACEVPDPVNAPAEKKVFDGWTKTELSGDVTLTANWADDNDEDNIPDKYQFVVTFTVVEGTWSEGDNADKTVTLTKRNSDGEFDESGTAKLDSGDIPAGMEANTNYGNGSWGVGDAIPSTETALSAAKTYTYTFVEDLDLTYPGAVQPKVPGPGDENPKVDKEHAIESGKTLTLALNGGDLNNTPNNWARDNSNSQNIQYTSPALTADVDLTAADFIPKTREGYIFNGWGVPQTDASGNVTLEAQWLEDKIGGSDGGDNIPDIYQIKVTFKLDDPTQGTWSDTTTDDIEVYLTRLKDKKYDKNATVTLTGIPTDMLPAEGYAAGAWDPDLPVAAIGENKVYTYKFEAKKDLTYPGPVIPGPENDEVKEEKLIEKGKSLTIDPNGGSFSEGDKTALGTAGFAESSGKYTKTVTEAVEVTVKPTKTDKVFDGYTKDVDASGNVTLKAKWEDDIVGKNGSDGIPDKYQFTVTFKIENGTWKSPAGGNADKTVVLNKLNKDGKFDESGTASLSSGDIPTGMVAKTGYNDTDEGSGWDTVPNTDTELGEAKTYTYTYTFVPSENAVNYHGRMTNSDPKPTYVPKSANIYSDHTVTLVLDGGSFTSTPSGWTTTDSGLTYTQTITADCTVPDPNTAPTGKIFNGWKDVTEGTDLTNGNLKLKAQWLDDVIGGSDGGDNIPDCYQKQVTFVSANGYIGTKGVTRKVEYATLMKDSQFDTNGSGQVTVPAMTANDGYHDGVDAKWGDGTPTITSNEMTVSGTQTVEYTYTFAPNQYKIVFNGNGATSGTMADQTLTYDKADEKLTANAYVRTGYNFNGWNTKKTPTQSEPGTSYADQATKPNATTAKDGSVTLYAQWTAKTPQTITAENLTLKSGDTGKSVGATLTTGNGALSYAVASGESVTVNATTGAITVVKPGVTQITISAAETDDYAAATKTITVTVDPCVTYHLNGGEITQADPGASKITGTWKFYPPYNSTKKGAYKLAETTELAGGKTIHKTNNVLEGWFTKDGSSGGDWGEEYTFPTNVTENIDIYARWTTDVIGGTTPTGEEEPYTYPDGIPDKYQVTVTFKVAGGSWNGGATSDVTKVLTLTDISGQWSETGSAVLGDPIPVPATITGYSGSWDSEPTAVTTVTTNKTYTYTFTANDNEVKFPGAKTPEGFEEGSKNVKTDKKLTIDPNGGVFSEGDKTALGTAGFTDSFGKYVKTINGAVTVEVKPTLQNNVFVGYEPIESEGNLTLKAMWLADIHGGSSGSDGIPDCYQLPVTFTVNNGSFPGGAVNKTIYLTTTKNSGGKTVYAKLEDGGTTVLTAGAFPAGTPDTGCGLVAGKWTLNGSTTAITLPGTATDTVKTYTNSNKDENNFVLSYVKNAYTIVYYDGSYAYTGLFKSGSHPTTHTYGTATPLVDANDKSDAVFVGWYLDAGFATKVTELGAEQFASNTNDEINVYGKWFNKGAVWGNVYLDKDNDNVGDSGEEEAGVRLYLKQGDEIVRGKGTPEDPEVKSDANGFYRFDQVPAGEYDVVAVKTYSGSEKTKTEYVHVISSSGEYQVPIVLPGLDISSKLKVADGESYDFVVGKLDELALQRADALNVTSGQKIEVIMNAASVTYDEGIDDMLAIETKRLADGKDHIDYFKFDLEEQFYSDIVNHPATHVDTPITDTYPTLIRINIPFMTADRCNFVVYRFHGLEVQTLTTTPNAKGEYIEVKDGMITVFAYDFSYYAVAYDDVTAPTPYTPSYYRVIAPTATANGKLTVSKEWNFYNEIVTLTAEPEPGYKPVVSAIRKDNGKPVELTDKGDGTYTFKMPASDVSVSVRFDSIICPRDESCPIEPFPDTVNDAWWHDGIHYCVENDLMIGFPDGEFKPYGLTTRAQIVMILWRQEGCPYPNYAMSFKDVKVGEWYAEAIRWAQAVGVVEGYSDDFFGPNDPVTREQLATILWRYAKLKNLDVSNNDGSTLLGFLDVESVHDWAIPALQWNCGASVVQGDSTGTLRPTDFATRAEAANMVYRFCENIMNLARGIRVH